MVREMICLIGGQTVPILLSIRCLHPQRVLLVHTSSSKEQAERLARVIRPTECQTSLVCTDAYNLDTIACDIRAHLPDEPTHTVFNLTGGTKPMSWAALQLALQLGATGPAPEMVYVMSERLPSRLYRYRAESGRLVLQTEPEEITEPGFTLDEYLELHLGEYTCGTSPGTSPGEQFERLVGDALQAAGFSVCRNVAQANLELDVVVQHGSHVAVLEVGTGNQARRTDKMRQLALADRRLRSTYLRLILVATQRVRERALADALGIKAVELLDSRADETAVHLSESDAKKLVHTVATSLGGGP